MPTIECPFCCNQDDLRPKCQGCNGRGVIIDHGPPTPAVGAPAGAPVVFVAVAASDMRLAALDAQGRIWCYDDDRPGAAWLLLPPPVEPG